MKNKYFNPWAKDLNVPMPDYYENCAPCILEHRGFEVYAVRDYGKGHSGNGFDFVLNGICVTQRAGASEAKKVIDSILDGKEPVSKRVKNLYPFLKTYEDFN